MEIDDLVMVAREVPGYWKNRGARGGEGQGVDKESLVVVHRDERAVAFVISVRITVLTSNKIPE